jgi:hypothetical protein
LRVAIAVCELFFWTAHEWLKLVASVVALAYFVVSGPLLFGPFGLLVVGVVRARMRLEAGDGGSEALFA